MVCYRVSKRLLNASLQVVADNMVAFTILSGNTATESYDDGSACCAIFIFRQNEFGIYFADNWKNIIKAIPIPSVEVSCNEVRTVSIKNNRNAAVNVIMLISKKIEDR